MKKYVTPRSVVLSMSMDENIAFSGEQVYYNGAFSVVGGKIQNTPFMAGSVVNGVGDFWMFVDAMYAWKPETDTNDADQLREYYKEQAKTNCYLGGGYFPA